MTATKFEREDRYLVLKYTDLVGLSKEQQEWLAALIYIHNEYRAFRQRPPLETVVVERDWPEFEVVWRMIQARMASKDAAPTDGQMTAEKYQQWVEFNWNRLGFERAPNQLRELFIMSVGLGGECGEVQELLKKFVRDGREIEGDLRLELGDVLHYLTRIASQFGMTLEEIMLANRSKIERRHTMRMEKTRAVKGESR
ncbi:MAG: MazG nucleotide pyrophosphohydrolase domain-containing protein [Rhodanobacter sp.]